MSLNPSYSVRSVEPYWFPVFLLAAIGINLSGCFNELMEPDAALYAILAKNIAQGNDWVNLYADGGDWLDKPHFPFWMAAISFKLFGISAFSYRLPSLLFWLLGVRYVYCLARDLFNTETARFAVLIFCSALHLYLATFDVRAEAMLTTLIAAASYHLMRCMERPAVADILATALFAAAALMTKGLFVLISIAGGLVLFWMFTAQWKRFLELRWWLILVCTLLFTFPEVYCLYAQFDLHPEKKVFGKTGVSGIRFFLWDSQFGRFFNTGPIKGSGDPFFFVHTFLWAFFPWAFLFIAALMRFKNLMKQSIHEAGLKVLLGSFVISFLLFSLSRFQLPHYLVILFPHTAIITAGFISGLKKASAISRWQIVMWIQLFIAMLLITALTLLTRFSEPSYSFLPAGMALLFLFAAGKTNHRLVATGVVTTLLLATYLSFYFYPKLLTYQSGLKAARHLNRHHPGMKAVMYNCSSYAFEFYGNTPAYRIADTAGLRKFMASSGGCAIYARQEDMELLKRTGFLIQDTVQFSNFHITALNGDFLNPGTRDNVLERFTLGICAPGSVDRFSPILPDSH
jgi:4-amino-4-deoxy-L-arabinose transferase-like glycosyltransferase